jgi:hypothetical protein
LGLGLAARSGGPANGSVSHGCLTTAANFHVNISGRASSEPAPRRRGAVLFSRPRTGLGGGLRESSEAHTIASQR